MSGPFIIISTWGVKEGKLEALKRFQRELSEIVQTQEPQIIAFNAFLNEDGTEMTSIQVHPNAASMDFHLKVIREHLGEAMRAVAEFAEPKGIEYYGAPPESLQASVSGRGGNLISKPVHIGGFTRLPAER
ncbi:MAG: putative quinol monooxygenase [Anaerolineales bacterium]|jgi:hypothetical protein